MAFGDSEYALFFFNQDLHKIRVKESFASSQQRERVEVLIKTSLSKKSVEEQTVLLQLEE